MQAHLQNKPPKALVFIASSQCLRSRLQTIWVEIGCQACIGFAVWQLPASRLSGNSQTVVTGGPLVAIPTDNSKLNYENRKNTKNY
jgi:hypothetical protein